MRLENQAPTGILRSLLSVALTAGSDDAIRTLLEALKYLQGE
jgi:hypothetical protein